MKKILNVIKEVESDFVSKNEKFNSYLELGSSYFAGNEYDKALGIFEKAIEEEPKNSGGWIGKAITHLAMSEVVNISSVNINDYVERAVNNSDREKIEKYLLAITLHYGYQYSSAIKLYIEQANQAIAEKKKAQVAAVIGMATAVAGGAIANNSKSFTGTFIGYSMLVGGVGATIKKGYDSFSLDKLSTSLYGNAFAQSILSVPTIQSCHRIYEDSEGDLKHNVGVILDSWKESIIYLFQNEKANFFKLLNELNDTDKLLNPEIRNSVQEKMDEILYFMDMIGMDESKNFKKVEHIKSILLSFTQNFNEEQISSIKKKRAKAQTGCGIVALVIFFILFQLDKNMNVFRKTPKYLGWFLL
ncbi:MAG: hypothetical protein IPO85_12300 [Saprospiraceae bacterium]|uniref:Tetratricopeptide repeat protein n=1 Tax=Candidatus Defluviibacterium haderslevense TaxID=2981993 RepID=A0A9D7SB93_9BACT|nr:hypothetical protein [Candidatus Defluviibacterium haderslevense]